MQMMSFPPLAAAILVAILSLLMKELDAATYLGAFADVRPDLSSDFLASLASPPSLQTSFYNISTVYDIMTSSYQFDLHLNPGDEVTIASATTAFAAFRSGSKSFFLSPAVTSNSSSSTTTSSTSTPPSFSSSENIVSPQHQHHRRHDAHYGLLNHNIDLQAGEFSCAPPLAANDVYTMCSGIVDYAYVLPDGLTPADMNMFAINSATGLTSFIKYQCLTDIKRLICANVYLPCMPGITASDPSTYPLLGGFIPFPYKRPCESLCVATTFSGTSCAGLLEMLGTAPDCSTVDPLTTLPTYDETNDHNWCNNLDTTLGLQLVADTHEPYIFETCKGIITEFAVPNPTTVSPYFAPLQPPFVMQYIAEMGIKAVDAQIPKFFTPACLSAQFELYCSLFFFRPHSSDAVSFIFGPVEYPDFPARSLCTNYADQCSKFIDATPSVAMDCDKEVSPGVKLFPENDQELFSLDLGWGPIPFVQTPFDPDVTKEFATECPEIAFSPAPNHLTAGMTAIASAPYINCVYQCPLKMYSEAELVPVYKYQLNTIICLFFLCALALFNVLYASKSSNIFVVVFLFFMLIDNLLTILTHFVTGFDIDSIICYSNIAWLQASDNTSASNMCGFIAVVGECTSWVVYWLAISASSELWFKVVASVKDVTVHRYFYLYGTTMIMIVNIALVLTDEGSSMNPELNPTALYSYGKCQWKLKDENRNFYLHVIPHLIYFGYSLMMGLHILYTCLKISLAVTKEGDNAIAKLWASYRLMFMLLILELLAFPIVIFYFEIYIPNTIVPKTTASVTSWINCLLGEFISNSDTSYIQTCNSRPAFRLEPESMQGTSTPLLIQTILILAITFTPAVRDWWKAILCPNIDKSLGHAFESCADSAAKMLGLDSHEEEEEEKEKEKEKASQQQHNLGKGILIKPVPVVAKIASSQEYKSNVSKVIPITADLEENSKTIEMKADKYKESPSNKKPSSSPATATDNASPSISTLGGAPTAAAAVVVGDGSIIKRLQSGVEDIIDAIKTTTATAAAIIGLSSVGGDDSAHAAIDQDELPGTPASESIFIDDHLEV